jgi:hypothetical protein
VKRKRRNVVNVEKKFKEKVKRFGRMARSNTDTAISVTTSPKSKNVLGKWEPKPD